MRRRRFAAMEFLGGDSVMLKKFTLAVLLLGASTRRHVSKFTKDTPLLPSGLLGPVTLQVAAVAPATEGKR
jgi:hypothetical protein